MTLFPGFLGRTKKTQETRVWGDTACDFGLEAGPVISPPSSPEAAPCPHHGLPSSRRVSPSPSYLTCYPHASAELLLMSKQLTRLALAEAGPPASSDLSPFPANGTASPFTCLLTGGPHTSSISLTHLGACQKRKCSGPTRPTELGALRMGRAPRGMHANIYVKAVL